MENKELSKSWTCYECGTFMPLQCKKENGQETFGQLTECTKCKLQRDPTKSLKVVKKKKNSSSIMCDFDCPNCRTPNWSARDTCSDCTFTREGTPGTTEQIKKDEDWWKGVEFNNGHRSDFY